MTPAARGDYFVGTVLADEVLVTTAPPLFFVLSHRILQFSWTRIVISQLSLGRQFRHPPVLYLLVI